MLTFCPPCSYFVLMPIGTLVEAQTAGWRLTVRCAWGPREGMKGVRECIHSYELDLQTLIRRHPPRYVED